MSLGEIRVTGSEAPMNDLDRVEVSAAGSMVGTVDQEDW